jgi:hypothetical protein
MFQGLMVVGFDVCHDTGSKTMSYGALVASLDKAMSHYFSAVSRHSSGEELSNNITAHMASKPPVHTFLIILTSIIVLTSSVVWWSEFLVTDSEAWVRFPVLPDLLRNNGSGTRSTQPREYN